MLDMGDTTWYRGRLTVILQRLILWRTQVALSRCNARKGVGQKWLKVRANPPRNRALIIRSDRSKYKGAASLYFSCIS